LKQKKQYKTREIERFHYVLKSGGREYPGENVSLMAQNKPQAMACRESKLFGPACKSSI
jgi:hypothetical protein